MHSIPAINAGESVSKLVEQTRFSLSMPAICYTKSE